MQKNYIADAQVSENEREKLNVAALAVFSGFNSQLTKAGNIHFYSLRNNKPFNVFIPRNGKMDRETLAAALVNICNAEELDVKQCLAGFVDKSTPDKFIFNALNHKITKNYINHHNSLAQIDDAKIYIKPAQENFMEIARIGGFSANGLAVLQLQIRDSWKEIRDAVEMKSVNNIINGDQGIPEVE